MADHPKLAELLDTIPNTLFSNFPQLVRMAFEEGVKVGAGKASSHLGYAYDALEKIGQTLNSLKSDVQGGQISLELLGYEPPEVKPVSPDDGEEPEPSPEYGEISNRVREVMWTLGVTLDGHGIDVIWQRVRQITNENITPEQVRTCLKILARRNEVTRPGRGRYNPSPNLRPTGDSPIAFTLKPQGSA